MLQMTKLAQYCQNFAQQLQEEADEANGGMGDSEVPKISVNLGDLSEVNVQRQRILEAQVTFSFIYVASLWFLYIPLGFDK